MPRFVRILLYIALPFLLKCEKAHLPVLVKAKIYHEEIQRWGYCYYRDVGEINLEKGNENQLWNEEKVIFCFEFKEG